MNTAIAVRMIVEMRISHAHLRLMPTELMQGAEGDDTGAGRTGTCAAAGQVFVDTPANYSGLSVGASCTRTFKVFFEARIRASSFDSTAVTVTPSGETVTTKYGIPDFGGW